MASTKISDMTAATDIVSATIPIVQGGVNKRAASTLFAQGKVMTDVAYVETTGSDSTGTLGRADLPFLTITGALNALPSTGGVIKIGIGDFTAPADDASGASEVPI